MTLETRVAALLDVLEDPFLNMTGKDMGLTYVLEEAQTKIIITIKTGFPSEFLKRSYVPLAQNTIEKLCPNQELTINIQEFIKAHKTQLFGKGLRGVKNTIAIASGKGGVGKSTVCVNLATALARAGSRVGILDADIYGPSIPLMLGATAPVEVKDDHYLPVMAHGIQAMSIGYLTDNSQALIWRGPMLAKSLIQMLDCTLWQELDYLFIDLPPGTGDIQLTLVQKIPITAAVVVTTPQNVAILDAQKALIMFEKTSIDVLGIVENMSTHQCSQCGHEENVFGEGGAADLCNSHHSELLGQLPLNGLIRKHSDEGRPTASLPDDALADTFVKTALHMAIKLAKKPVNYADKFPPIVVE